MPTLIKLENYPSINIKERAELAEEVAAAATAVPLVSAQNIAEGVDFLYIGRPGQEKVEKRLAGAVTGNSVAVSALAYAHPQFGVVNVLRGDQIQVYRAANVDGTPPADSSFSEHGSKVDIDPDQIQTDYNDATGSTSFWYKYRYYNSDSSSYVTDLSEVKAIRGAEYGNYTTIAAIRIEAGIQNNPYISDKYVADKRAQAQAIINAALKGTYTVPFTGDIPEVVERMVELLAAGYILKAEFGDQATGTDRDGQGKIDEVLRTDEDNPGLLQQVINGTYQLTDEAGGTVATTERISGWPNATTADTAVEDGGSKRKMRMGMKF